MFHRAVALVAACATAASASAQVPAQDTLTLSARVGLATGLVRRGIDLSDEAVIPMLDVAVEHRSGFYVHGGLTRASLPKSRYYYESRESTWETVADIGYLWQASERWSLSFAHHWYLYTDDSAGGDPDYREWTVSLDYNSFVALDYAHTEELWGRATEQDAFELTGRWPFTRRLIGAASLGHVTQRGLYDDHYQYLRLNLGYLFGDFSVQLQFHDTRGVSDFYPNDRTGSQWVGEVNWHW